jgi:AcrR family transcriptional regulator
MKTRTYRMGARAEAAAATGERILDAAEALFWQEPGRQVTLQQVAQRAGVSVQTVIRRYGGSEGVEAAARERSFGRMEAQRGEAAPGDVGGAVAVLIDHYEALGDGVIRMLADEHRRPLLTTLVELGRAYHAEWCERVFAPALTGLRGGRRDRRLAQIITVCDVYTWKLLRRDRGLSRSQTELALRELLEPLTTKEQ